MLPAPDDPGLPEALLGDGRPLLTFTGLILVLSGGFALFLSATGEFLPHDVRYLGMTVPQLCSQHQCRIVHFMIHDRVSFGGALIAIGSLYMWLAEFPLRQGAVWAWWLFLLSGLLGFASFLAYLGYGYLDTWHGLGTLLLLPVYVLGMARSWRTLPESQSIRCLFRPSVRPLWTSALGLGRACLLATSAGMIAGGLTIMAAGMTCVFVPQDLSFMGLSVGELRHINPHLIPLIAHDRAGFGGGLCATGITVLFCVWCGKPSRSLWQVLAWAGLAGFGCAIGVHPLVGYVDPVHLAPAFVGAGLFIAGLILSYGPMVRNVMPGQSEFPVLGDCVAAHVGNLS